ARSAETYGQALEATEDDRAPPDGRAAEHQAREAGEQRGNRGARLEARELRARTEMRAEPEPHVRVRRAAEVEPLGLGESGPDPGWPARCREARSRPIEASCHGARTPLQPPGRRAAVDCRSAGAPRPRGPRARGPRAVARAPPDAAGGRACRSR